MRKMKIDERIFNHIASLNFIQLCDMHQALQKEIIQGLLTDVKYIYELQLIEYRLDLQEVY